MTTNEELADWLDDKARIVGRRLYQSKETCEKFREIAHRVRNCASWHDDKEREYDCDAASP